MSYTPIRDKSGFYVARLKDAPVSVWIESNRIEECMAYYREQSLSQISISPYMGYQLTYLDFLKSHTYVMGINLPSAGKIDVRGLAYLPNLEYLLISESKQPIDLGQFSKLRELYVEWHAKTHITPECSALRVLSLRKYRPNSKNLRELPPLPALEKLSIVQSPILSVDGVGRFSGLGCLELSYLAKLESIDAAREIRDHLHRLELGDCRSIQSYDVLALLTNLQWLRISNCADIPSIEFIGALSRLEFFSFVNTNVVDGDMTPCLRVPKTGFIKRPHYSHSQEEIEELQKSRPRTAS